MKVNPLLRVMKMTEQTSQDLAEYPTSTGLRLLIGSWAQLKEPATQVRYTVFVDEQQVPVEMELDEFDAVSSHAVVLDSQNQPLATGRLLPDGHIGRMAVMASARGLGLGAQVLQALIDLAKQKAMPEVVLSAQVHALGFYQKQGFIAAGDVYLDCGIEHKDMRLVLA